MTDDATPAITLPTRRLLLRSVRPKVNVPGDAALCLIALTATSYGTKPLEASVYNLDEQDFPVRLLADGPPSEIDETVEEPAGNDFAVVALLLVAVEADGAADVLVRLLDRIDERNRGSIAARQAGKRFPTAGIASNAAGETLGFVVGGLAGGAASSHVLGKGLITRVPGDDYPDHPDDIELTAGAAELVLAWVDPARMQGSAPPPPERGAGGRFVSPTADDEGPEELVQDLADLDDLVDEELPELDGDDATE